MKYQFQITLTDEDYLNYNLFYALRSPYAAKTNKRVRVFFSLLMIVTALALLISDGLRYGSLFAASVVLALVLVYNLRYKRSIVNAYRNLIKRNKKNGKVAYTPKSTLELGEDFLVETSPDNKTEQKYSSIERISVIKDRYVYLHINHLMAYIIPMTSFASNEEYQSFFEFARANITDRIDFYEEI